MAASDAACLFGDTGSYVLRLRLRLTVRVAAGLQWFSSRYKDRRLKASFPSALSRMSTRTAGPPCTKRSRSQAACSLQTHAALCHSSLVKVRQAGCFRLRQVRQAAQPAEFIDGEQRRRQPVTRQYAVASNCQTDRDAPSALR